MTVSNGRLKISNSICIPCSDIQLEGIRAQGSGGQNVNKVASAVHLRFDIRDSCLPEYVKQRLLQLRDQRINADGIVVIKAQEFRSRQKNTDAAMERLQELVRSVLATRKKRKPTRPGRAAERRRVDNKTRRGQIKRMRSNKPDAGL